MHSHLLLEMWEESIEWISSIGNVEFRILQVSKEMWHVPNEWTIRRPYASMGVVPLCSSRDERTASLLIDEVTPPCVPFIESFRECCLIHVWKSEYQRSELLSSFCLWFPRQVLRHLLHLVELTDLQWYIVKYSDESTSAIDDCCGNSPTFLFEYGSPISVVQHLFTGDFCPVYILFEWRWSEYTDSVGTPPEGRVCNDDRGLWRCLSCWRYRSIQMLPYPYVGTIMFLSELFECLFALCIVTPQLLVECSWSSWWLKWSPTITTTIPLDSSGSTILFSTKWEAGRTRKAFF